MVKSFLINLLPGFLVRAFARPYVSGNSIDKGIAKADQLYQEKAFFSTMDLLGEAVTTREEVDRNIKIYLELIDKVSGRNYITISLKPTSLGIHESFDYCRTNIETIVKTANVHNIKITLDMEDHTYTDVTLQLYQDILEKYPTFGTVLQSRLFRTPNDIANLARKPGRIRMCIGIYNESKDIALIDKSQMKQRLIEFTRELVNYGTFVEIATHDKNTISQALSFAKENSWGPDKIEFQQLLGVPLETIQKQLLDEGFVVRLYVPFATDWKYATPYLKRRLANNPKMAFYVIKHLFKK